MKEVETSIKNTSKKASSKKKPQKSLDRSIQDFLKESLLPFHAQLSEANMDKEVQCKEFDYVIEHLAKINTVLTKKLRQKDK